MTGMNESADQPVPDRPAPEELGQLREKLSSEERDELLQRLLTASSRGGGAMVKVLEDLLLHRATQELLRERETLGRGVPCLAPDAFVAGADGCRSGWFVVIQHFKSGKVEHRTLPDFAGVIHACVGASVLAIDIPIGFMDTAEKGGRPVDRLVRDRLKPYRASSVFSPPCRPALACETYGQAATTTRSHSKTGHSLTLQAFGLFPKLREVDELMTPERQATVHEVHPELCFARMNEGRPLELSKKKVAGQEVRVDLLRAAGFDVTGAMVRRLAQGGVDRTDVLDAYAACWTAARIARGQAERLGTDVDRDSRGLRMEMWV
jgi:predicted RNase H-like nuclease